MKKLLVTYISSIALVFSLPVFIANLIGPKLDAPKAEPNMTESILPTEIDVYFADEGVTKSINFEEYIMGVLPAEMPASFEEEALKAQAVAARTYAYYKYLNYMKSPTLRSQQHPDAPVCTDSTHCHAYYSDERLEQLHGKDWIKKHLDRLKSYVRQTAGEIMAYDDEPILAAFHSASAGGTTQASGDVWGRDLPYLSNVESYGENEKAGYISTVEIGFEEFKSKVMEEEPEAVFSPEPKEWIGDVSFTRGNYVDTLEIGGKPIKGTKIRTMFGLNSTYFSVSISDDKVIFTVEGSGHGVGMSQYGANYMAKQGKTYKEILETYYKGASLIKTH
ncbi:MAG: stage II sporulation protein D [Eubacteriales bacterium]|jgi:stage II sporulation protein D|nr:stage II sporulation protein D [Eubacteriales bacterium]